MADESADGQEKTEDPTDERREEFRKKGDIAHSRELTSVFVLVGVITFISMFALQGYRLIQTLFITSFSTIQNYRVISTQLSDFSGKIWVILLSIIIPICLVAITIATTSTLIQTRVNVAFGRLKPNFSKLNIFSGLKRLVSGQAAMELFKGIGKMFAVGLVTGLILYSERNIVPGLINVRVTGINAYWFEITRLLIWATASLLLIIAASDYLYNYMTIEKKMKMSKHEIKEEFKKREVDPMIRGRMRKMQKDMSSGMTIKETEKATVLITNPTHYAIAIQYEIGMAAPKVIAKGTDLLALSMREVAKKFEITMVENRPLARTLYKTVEVGDLVPESLYQAISEIIRYVFKVKGIRLPKKSEKN